MLDRWDLAALLAVYRSDGGNIRITGRTRLTVSAARANRPMPGPQDAIIEPQHFDTREIDYRPLADRGLITIRKYGGVEVDPVEPPEVEFEIRLTRAGRRAVFAADDLRASGHEARER